MNSKLKIFNLPPEEELIEGTDSSDTNLSDRISLCFRKETFIFWNDDANTEFLVFPFKWF